MHSIPSIQSKSPELGPYDFSKWLVEIGVTFVTGVPDSTLGGMTEIFTRESRITHRLAVNEGSAIAMACGSYLGTRNVPLVYFQNSGLGNALNPLVSVAHKSASGIPIILLIGWRGMPGSPDEPQHLKQGSITKSLLEALDIPCTVLRKSGDAAKDQLVKIAASARKFRTIHAILVEPKTFSNIASPKLVAPSGILTRRTAIKAILDSAPQNAAFVSSTGYISREAHSLLKQDSQRGSALMMLPGGMGHASSVALGLALSKRDTRVICLDGDGSSVMHMGALATISDCSSKIGLIYVILNNGVHESTGGQQLDLENIHYGKLMKALGFKGDIHSVSNGSELSVAMRSAARANSSVFIEIFLERSSEPPAGRPEKPLDLLTQEFLESLRC